MKALSSLCAVAMLVCSGCPTAGPEIARVEGTVTMDENPLANAAVIFMPESGRPAAGETDENGHYELNFSGGKEGAQPGNYRVRITTAKGQDIDETGALSDPVKEIVPKQYNQNTKLEAIVNAGELNVLNFEITSDGEVIQEEGY